MDDIECNNGTNRCLRTEDCNLRNDMNNGICNQVMVDVEDLAYVLDNETTPVKDCGDSCNQFDRVDKLDKESDEQRGPSSQLKRQRMLKFDNQITDSNERKEFIEEALASSESINGFEDFPTISYECLDELSGEDLWLTEWFNDPNINPSSDDMNFSGASNLQSGISGFHNDSPASEATTAVRRHSARTHPNVVIRGRKLIGTPVKLASSIAYPFAIIKPCTFHGDVTLKDINQKIYRPSPSESNQKDNDPGSYPTSAFSGKPVVGKTKIPTRGGKGSITIMRTEG